MASSFISTKKETEMNAMAMSSSILVYLMILKYSRHSYLLLLLLLLKYPRQILGLAPVEIDPNYLCSFSKDLLREPVQASCGHRYCRNCLERLVAGLSVFVCVAHSLCFCFCFCFVFVF